MSPLLQSENYRSKRMLYEQKQTKKKIDKTLPSKHQQLDREHDRVNQELIRLAMRGERFSTAQEEA
jgi:hypothetical protein